MVNIKINDVPISVEEGTTILEACREAKMIVPTLCYLKDINEIGACRVCVVEIKGIERLVTSCNNTVKEGMEIYTNSPKVRDARRINIKLILSQHNCFCPTCVRSGNCQLQKVANEVRKDIVTALHAAKAGHPGGSLSAADLFTYLYFEEMNIDPKDPKKADRDRFVLSKGHTAPGLYSVLAERGYFPKEDLVTLRHLGSYLQGHPDMKHIPGVDMSSGSLGQGISAAVGMALSAKLSNDSYRVYTLLGDGEIQEGQVWEAAMFAGARKLDNLVVIVDNNGLQIDGKVEDVCSPYPIDKKFEAFNFHVINVADGNDMAQLRVAFDEAKTVKGMPTAIVMKTVKGKGVSFMENQVGWHGKAPNDEEYAQAMADLEKVGEALCQK